MLDRMLPRQIDNDYRGHKLAPWLFGAAVLGKLGVMIIGLALSLQNRAQPE